MPAGRPKITLEDLPEGWKEKTLELAKNGGSDVEIRVEVLGGISFDLWTRLLEEEQEFSQTIKTAREFCKAWWKKQGRIQLENKEFSPTLWYMNMKNRFGWKDKQDITSGGKELPTPILGYVSKDNSNSEDNGAEQTD